MEAPSMVQKTQRGGSSLCFPHVLVVGHNQICNQEIQRELQLHSFQVTTLTQPSIAISLLRKIRSGHFQLLIIDIDNSSHIALFMNLKQFGLQMGLPVVMMSKSENHSLMTKVLKSGVCCFLIKPINVDLLTSTCEQYALKKNSLLQNAISKMWRKKERMIWDLDLHHRFLEVVSKLEPKYCTPMNILALMNVPGLTRKNVSSHLQSYLNHLKKSPNGEHFPSYSMPSKALPSISSFINTPKARNFDNISFNQDQSTAKNLRRNTDLVGNRRNMGMFENPAEMPEFNSINNNMESQTMCIEENDNGFLNCDISENSSMLNEISDGTTYNGHHPEFTLLNFNNDIDRPTSPYPPFPESYDQVPDSPSFTYAIDQIFRSSELHDQVLENNQSLPPNRCFTNDDPTISLEFDSSEIEYLYSVMGIPVDSSNSNQVTKSVTNDHVQWAVGGNPNNNGDDGSGLFDWVSSSDITQGSSFSSQQFDEVDFEGLFF